MVGSRWMPGRSREPCGDCGACGCWPAWSARARRTTRRLCAKNMRSRAARSPTTRETLRFSPANQSPASERMRC